MKPKRLHQLEELLESDEFQSWWKDFSEVRTSIAAATARYDQLLGELNVSEFRAELQQKNAIDTLYLSGECDDEAAQYLTEASKVENFSTDAVGEYEEHRFVTSDAWIRLGAMEKKLEDADAELKAAKDQGAAGRLEVERVSGLIDRLKREERNAEKAYEDALATKNRMWSEVEAHWGKSLELYLLCSEKQAKGRRVKTVAERLFAEAEAAKRDSEARREEADTLSAEKAGFERRMEALRDQARQSLGGVVGDDFMYWGSMENDKVAYCVPFIEDHDHYNMEVQPLRIYRVTAKLGVKRLEPPPPEGVEMEEGDQRIEAYFLEGRATAD